MAHQVEANKNSYRSRAASTLGAGR